MFHLFIFHFGKWWNRQISHKKETFSGFKLHFKTNQTELLVIWFNCAMERDVSNGFFYVVLFKDETCFWCES